MEKKENKRQDLIKLMDKEALESKDHLAMLE